MIYATPHDRETKQVTGASVDSGFESVAQAAQLLGPDYFRKSPRIVIYDDTVYSDFILSHTDGPGNNEETLP